MVKVDDADFNIAQSDENCVVERAHTPHFPTDPKVKTKRTETVKREISNTTI